MSFLSDAHPSSPCPCASHSNLVPGTQESLRTLDEWTCVCDRVNLWRFDTEFLPAADSHSLLSSLSYKDRTQSLCLSWFRTFHHFLSSQHQQLGRHQQYPSMGSGIGVQYLTCTNVNHLPGSAGDHKRTCYHSFRFHLLPLPSLDAAQGSLLLQGPCSFPCMEPGPRQHNWGRRELSRCPPHSGSEPQPPGYCGELLSSPLISPSSNPRELWKSTPVHPTDEGTMIVLTEARHSHIPLASLIPSFGAAVLRGAGTSVFLGYVNESDFTWWVTRRHCMEPALNQERSYCRYTKAPVDSG